MCQLFALTREHVLTPQYSHPSNSLLCPALPSAGIYTLSEKESRRMQVSRASGHHLLMIETYVTHYLRLYLIFEQKVRARLGLFWRFACLGG